MSLQHILLGLLSDEPGSGYDLNKRLQAEGQHFWTTDQSQIYRALYKMQAEGWVDYETVIQQDSPNKKVYHVTDNGVEQLQEWLHTEFDESPPGFIWLAKLYLGHELEADDVQKILSERLDTIKTFKSWAQRSYAELSSNGNGSNGTDKIHRIRLMTIEYKLQMLNAEITWLETQLETIKHLQIS
ncbi:MAG: PadR family transcriptional regulator [Chloroflexota bacterium]